LGNSADENICALEGRSNMLNEEITVKMFHNLHACLCMVHALRVRDGTVRASSVSGLLLAPGTSNKMVAPNRND